MSRAESLGSVAWRSVFVEHAGQRASVLLDGKVTLRAALDLARKASLTYPDVAVSVFRGARIGRLTATFRSGVSTDARTVEASR